MPPQRRGRPGSSRNRAENGPKKSLKKYLTVERVGALIDQTPQKNLMQPRHFIQNNGIAGPPGGFDVREQEASERFSARRAPQPSRWGPHEPRTWQTRLLPGLPALFDPAQIRKISARFPRPFRIGGTNERHARIGPARNAEPPRRSAAARGNHHRGAGTTSPTAGDSET